MHIFAFFVEVAISLAPTIFSPFPSADSALVCIASTEAIHIVLSKAFSIAAPFLY
jgi:16S rRNA A1518/A1519 N6-dimethyltransferase RsmA/KsgA/DIM1 with predicted DNA glycosylase/AP lyase activity